VTAAVALVAQLRARGIELVPAGDRLRYRPVDALTPDELAALRALKADVLALLTAPTLPPRYFHPWPDALSGLGRRTVGPFEACADCERWSWARYGDVVLCLACARQRERMSCPLGWDHITQVAERRPRGPVAAMPGSFGPGLAAPDSSDHP
jgi:hypothetical protein